MGLPEAASEPSTPCRAVESRCADREPLAPGTDEAGGSASLAARVLRLERRLDELAAARVPNPTVALGPAEGSVLIGLLTRIADAIAPVPAVVVDTPYVARRLGCTTTWVSELVRSGGVPKGCVVPGTGHGKP